MEFKLNKEEICTSEVILNAQQEQSVELDYVLPDYFPEIFKIIRCFAVPRIAACSMNGNRLTYDISVSLRILYCPEESGRIQVIEQKLLYTKSADASRTGTNPDIKIIPKVDYINCRAVNQRRIDVRGAVSTSVTVTDVCKNEIISDAFGMDIELKKIPVTYPANRLYASKQISVNEEFELGMSKPPIENILYFDAVVASTDKKVIANKIVAKGEISVNMLYIAGDSENAIESMQFTVPFSQIIDIEGIDERFECYIDADIASCDISPKSDGDGNSKIAECALTLIIKCTACRAATVELAADEYSTSYDSSDTKSEVRIDSMPRYINLTSIIKESLNAGESNISGVYTAICSIKDCSFTPDSENERITVNGTANYCVMACDEEKKIISIEKDGAFTFYIPEENLSDSCNINLKAVPMSCSYNIGSDNTVEVKAELKVCGSVCCSEIISGISDIFIDESSEPCKKDECAMKLYFAEKGESVWDISKRYRSPVKAVADENDIDNDIIENDCMLIIPIL